MARQYSNPYLVRGDKTTQLLPAKKVFNENWLQGFIFKNHHSLPINEIEPAFGPLIPVCRELPTKAGPIDMLFINSLGLPTLVECKLWKNPEARREVVGQMLDYAKEISQWSYETLEEAIRKAEFKNGSSLYELVTKNAEEIDERDFIDSVSRNLRRGRFLLLLLGDGIRENVVQITDFLHNYAHLNFSLALVEYSIFELSEHRDEFIVVPRLVAQTVEIERAVFRIEDNQIVTTPPMISTETPAPKKAKISEQIFFETANLDSTAKDSLKALLAKLQPLGIYVEPGKNSLKLKSSQYGINFGIFTVGGEFYNCGIASTTEEMGRPEIGEDYLQQLANLLKNGFIKRSSTKFWWTVNIKRPKGERYPKATEILDVQDKWIEIIQQALNRLAELEPT